MSASHPSEAATRVTVGDHTFFPDNAARDLEAMAYEYETNLRFKLDSTSAGLFLRNVAHGLRMCARTLDRAARSPAPEPDFVDELLIADRRRAAPSVEARDADADLWELGQAYIAFHDLCRQDASEAAINAALAHRNELQARIASLLLPETT